MFKKLFQKLTDLAPNRQPFDPSQFDDPVATQTAWTPAKGGGASFRTHKLVQVAPDRLVFRAALGAWIFYLIFLIAGLAIAVGFTVSHISKGTFAWSADTVLPLAFGGVFAAIGGLMLYFGTAPIIFDKTAGFFWKGRKAPHEVVNIESIKYFAELKNIHALQIIAEFIRSDKSSYTSYELNLVLQDGSRINVVDHGNPTKLRDDAHTLAQFLNIPLWDAA